MSVSLGAFSVSLSVADLEASRRFYEVLGFVVLPGTEGPRSCILRNGTTTLGLFQGMFPKNTLTFNPGWDAACGPVEGFVDVRDLQASLEARGLEPVVRADPSSTGPAFVMLADPDGNPVLLDQHVPRPSAG